MVHKINIHALFAGVDMVMAVVGVEEGDLIGEGVAVEGMGPIEIVLVKDEQVASNYMLLISLKVCVSKTYNFYLKDMGLLRNVIFWLIKILHLCTLRRLGLRRQFML